jgi:hypothetical protein
MRTLRARGRSARGIDLKASPFTDATGSIADRGFVRAAITGASVVLHTATLHKPHVGTHAQQEFVDTNVSGTLALLEAATAGGVEAFVFTSTTSAFGSALTPAPGAPATWITEAVTPVPRNIYGTTKLAAEALAELAHRRDRLPVVILRTGRFFPEGDDDPEVRAGYGRDNAQVKELLYRRADIADVPSSAGMPRPWSPGVSPRRSGSTRPVAGGCSRRLTGSMSTRRRGRRSTGIRPTGSPAPWPTLPKGATFAARLRARSGPKAITRKGSMRVRTGRFDAGPNGREMSVVYAIRAMHNVCTTYAQRVC